MTNIAVLDLQAKQLTEVELSQLDTQLQKAHAQLLEMQRQYEQQSIQSGPTLGFNSTQLYPSEEIRIENLSLNPSELQTMLATIQTKIQHQAASSKLQQLQDTITACEITIAGFQLNQTNQTLAEIEETLNQAPEFAIRNPKKAEEISSLITSIRENLHQAGTSATYILDKIQKQD